MDVLFFPQQNYILNSLSSTQRPLKHLTIGMACPANEFALRKNLFFKCMTVPPKIERVLLHYRGFSEFVNLYTLAEYLINQIQNGRL